MVLRLTVVHEALDDAPHGGEEGRRVDEEHALHHCRDSRGKVRQQRQAGQARYGEHDDGSSDTRQQQSSGHTGTCDLQQQLPDFAPNSNSHPCIMHQASCIMQLTLRVVVLLQSRAGLQHTQRGGRHVAAEGQRGRRRRGKWA